MNDDKPQRRYNASYVEITLERSNGALQQLKELYADIDDETRQRLHQHFERTIDGILSRNLYVALLGDEIERYRNLYGNDVVETALAIATKDNISFIDAIPKAQYMIWFEQMQTAINGLSVSMVDIARAFSEIGAMIPAGIEDVTLPANRHERRAQKHGKRAIKQLPEWKKHHNRNRH